MMKKLKEDLMVVEQSESKKTMPGKVESKKDVTSELITGYLVGCLNLERAMGMG